MFVNPRFARAARVTVLVCCSTSHFSNVCLSQKQYAYQTGNEGEKICAVFSENPLLQRYGIICVSSQHVCPCLLFVTTEASLLVEKANDILSILEILINKYIRQQVSQGPRWSILIVHAFFVSGANTFLHMHARICTENLHFSAFHVFCYW